MIKKIAIVGKGSAGALSSLAVERAVRNSKFSHKNIKLEIEWHFDSSIPTQTVGEGTNLVVPNLLTSMGFNYDDLYKLDGNFKTGISKRNWGDRDYKHLFAPPLVSYHLNAIKLQDYAFGLLKEQSHVKIFDNHVHSNQIDADVVIDCSGRPESYDDFEISSYIPVNSVYVTQCFWDYPKFYNSITDAMPYGWVFGIPLQNRCAIGYLYNNEINTLDEIKEDVKNVFRDYNLTPSEKTNAFSFKNYYRKNNFVDNIAYNGNASTFLEPLEATTLSQICITATETMDSFLGDNNTLRLKDLNARFKRRVKSTEVMIMCHYLAGSRFKTKFWDYAEERAQHCIKEHMKSNDKFNMIIDFINEAQSLERSKEIYTKDNFISHHPNLQRYLDFLEPKYNELGSWNLGSWYSNVKNLNILDKINTMRE